MALKQMPKVGDNVRFLGGDFHEDMSIGNVYVINEVDYEGDALFEDDAGETSYICEETLPLFELVRDVEEDSPSVTDLIANLARRVSELEACLVVEQAHRADLTRQNAEQAYEINELYKAVARL
ncbi:hypothetical protein [Sporosarcina sp. SAFN-015]|uniref:hypothetical protein n=1 Tax=Sporosarcina sp. SAFN-015 TaxID=3387274 RepID=UPI003F7F222C